MEIISYVGAAAGNERSRRRNFLKRPPLPRTKKFAGIESHFGFAKSENKAKKFYPVLLLKKLGKFLYIIPIVIVAFLLAYGATEIIANFQSRANPLSLENEREDEMSVLQNAMSRLALSTGDEVDADGNVAGSDVSLSLFQDKVTYKDYVVKSGETIGGITSRFGLKNISTIIAVNEIENVRQVFSGQKLVIPSCDGLLHVVAQGDSLASISAKYSVAWEDLLDANDLDSTELVAGQKIFIPGAKLSRDELRKAMGETWATPLKSKWRLTSKCGWRADPFTGVKQYHPGMDMACPTGTPIYATMGGKVLASGVSRIYGNYIIIDHGNGYQTLYGHMSKRISVAGEQVSQNQKIGLVGSTGYSTGPHLHFTVYKNGKVVDPQTLLGK
ncbi:MAG: LysM peptidoglycan-binding domain-containing M23 family metallopeptidase [Treponemataceae bacterium]|nr:LysM peptidoglycan-binding domain-containing M23 family metallopeptidase [Treponemataceae bacterium]